MNEVDINIVENNLQGAVVGKCIDDEAYCLVSQVVSSVRPLPFNPEIEAQAHENSRKISLYDSRRLIAAFQHGVSLVTCDPTHFTLCPFEREHIRKFGYADISIGESESDDGLVDAKVWVFSPRALSVLLRNLDSNTLESTNRSEMLSLVNYTARSDINGSTAEVELLFDGETLRGNAADPGAIDVLLRAVEKAVEPYIRLTRSNVHLEMSDTTANNDVVQIYLRLHINGHQFEATTEGLNTLTCSVHAYLRTINAALSSQENE